MDNEELLGAFEEVVLLTVSLLEGAGYGLTIREAVADRTQRKENLGAIYAALRRLEGKGLVVSREGHPSESRRGRPRRYFRILPSGVEALERMRTRHHRIWRDVKLPDPHPAE